MGGLGGLRTTSHTLRHHKRQNLGTFKINKYIFLDIFYLESTEHWKETLVELVFLSNFLN
jgi:hypothetical protein